MRHPSWKEFTDMIGDFCQRFSGSIYDESAGRSWDAGQFVCRVAYGPDWSSDPQFKADDALPDSEPVPEIAMTALRNLLNNGLPDYARCL